MRPSWIEVDLDAVRANTAAIAAAVAPAVLCAVVKADGYGHGDVPVARAALDGGATWLAVALVEEGARLRDAGVDAPILLLSEPPPGDAARLMALDLTPSVYTPAFLGAVALAAQKAGREPCAVHIKLNTGMHRVGAEPADAFDLVRQASDDPRVTVGAVWTHYAVSEDDAEFTRRQSRLLTAFHAALIAEGIDIPMVHAANTAAALDHPESRYDMVRVGLGIYGMRPAAHVGAGISLRPAMRVVSRVAMVRRLDAGERPSYGRIRPMPAPGAVATVPVGYADGVARRLSEVGGQVLIRGRRYPHAGRVTMDQIVVDVGSDTVEPGDEVVLMGAQGDEVITAEDWAGWLDTINYEIVCDFGPRLPRRYAGAP